MSRKEPEKTTVKETLEKFGSTMLKVPGKIGTKIHYALDDMKHSDKAWKSNFGAIFGMKGGKRKTRKPKKSNRKTRKNRK